MMNNYSIHFYSTIITPINLLIITSLISVFYSRKKLLVSLISLEFVVLSLFINLVLLFDKINQPISICFYMMILGACEASLSLTLLVLMTRLKGNDMLSLISKFKF